MQQPTPVSELSERAIHILEAAERCFARDGFHRATMQDVAREARMSPGNLYRYFPSKSEMVAGLIERDRALIAEKLELIKAEKDFRVAFLRLCWGYLAEEPVERIKLWIEIWAESTHNPDIAGLTARCDREMSDLLCGLFEDAKLRGQLPQSFDAAGFWDFLQVLSNGMMVQRALQRDFDAQWALTQVDSLFRLALEGKLPAARINETTNKNGATAPSEK